MPPRKSKSLVQGDVLGQSPSSRLCYIQRQAQRSLKKCSSQSTENTPTYPRQLKTPCQGLWPLSQPRVGAARQGLCDHPLLLASRIQRSPASWVCPQLPLRAPVSVLAPSVWGRHGAVPSDQLEGERGGAMASWAAWSMGWGGLLRRTISRPAFDLGQGLPASKWSQLLLQASGQDGAGGGGLEGRGAWGRGDSGASGNQEGSEKLEPRLSESKREARGEIWSPSPPCK